MEKGTAVNDYRSQFTKMGHNALGYTQEQIDIWNEGYGFHETHWPENGPATPLREAMQFSSFEMLDMSPRAEIYWAGYEQAARDRVAKGGKPQTYNKEDEAYALEQVLRYIQQGMK